MRRLALILLLGASVLGLAGCGGSSTLTKAQYAARLNGLCLLSADAVREMHLTTAMADWRRYGKKIVRLAAHFDNTLSALKPPASLTHLAETYLATNKKVLADDKAAVAAANAGDLKTFHRAISRGNTDVLATYPFAQAMGATGCYSP